jgi:hypothetical protein
LAFSLALSHSFLSFKTIRRAAVRRDGHGVISGTCAADDYASDMIPSLTDIKLWLDFSHPGLRILLIWALALLGLHFLRKVLRAIREDGAGCAR